MSESKKPTADPHELKDEDTFLHVVIYAGIFLVIGLIAAFLVIKGVGRHIVPGRHDPHPTSQLAAPSAKGSAIGGLKITESPFIFAQQKIRHSV
jgi:hypothetical protein